MRDDRNIANCDDCSWKTASLGVSMEIALGGALGRSVGSGQALQRADAVVYTRWHCRQTLDPRLRVRTQAQTRKAPLIGDTITWREELRM